MFDRVIVAVVGNSDTGKTTAIEAIISGLAEKGYRVASGKRIPEPEFTIDTEGKDTWRHAEAGASTVLSVAPKEIATIKKVDTKKYTLTQLIADIPDETDVIIIEGFKNLVGQDMSIPKIVATKTAEEVTMAQEHYKNILAFIGNKPDKKTDTGIPFIDVLKEADKLVDLVKNRVALLVERKRNREEKISIKLDEKPLPLGDFVQDITRNTILAMISSLKGVEIKGKEKVSLVIKSHLRG